MAIVIRVDGVDITPDVIFVDAMFAMEIGAFPGEFTLRVKDPTIKYDFKAANNITLDIDGIRSFDGYVLQASRDFAFPVVDTAKPQVLIWHLRGPSVNIMFKKRFTYLLSDPSARIPDSPIGTRDLTNLNDLVTNYLDLSGDAFMFDFHDVGSPNPDEPGLPWAIGDTWETAMQIIAALPGAVYGIRADRTVFYEDDDTENAPFRLSDRPNNTTTFGVSDLEWTFDGTHLANDAPAWGAGVGSPTRVFARTQDAASQAAHGRWQYPGEFRTDVYKQTTINAISSSIVYGSPQNLHGGKDDAQIVTCRIKKPGLKPGNKVFIESQVFGINKVLPIRRMTMTFPTPTDVLYDLQLSYDIDRPLSYHNYPPFKTTPVPVIKPIVVKPPCNNIGWDSWFGAESGWETIHSDPQLGWVGFGDAGSVAVDPSAVDFINKKKYWQNTFIFFPGDGFRVTAPYRLMRRDASAVGGRFILQFQFQVPHYNISPGYHLPPFPRNDFGNIVGGQSNDLYPFSTFEIIHPLTTGVLKLCQVRDGVHTVAGQTGSWPMGSSWNVEYNSEDGLRCWAAGSARPDLSMQHTGDPNGFAGSGSGISGPGTEAWRGPNFKFGYLYFLFRTWGGFDNYDDFLASSDYPVEIANTIVWSVSNVSLNPLTSGGDTGPAHCLDGVLGVPIAGSTFSEDLHSSIGSPTTYVVTYGFVAGSTKVEVNGTRQRLGIDYVEVAPDQIVFTKPLPAGLTVSITYTVAAR